jgi:hypothetical protein
MLDLLWVIGGGIVTLVIVAAVACWVARERAGETHDRQGED